MHEETRDKSDRLGASVAWPSSVVASTQERNNQIGVKVVTFNISRGTEMMGLSRRGLKFAPLLNQLGVRYRCSSMVDLKPLIIVLDRHDTGRSTYGFLAG
jgi:hypothetical protein